MSTDATHIAAAGASQPNVRKPRLRNASTSALMIQPKVLSAARRKAGAVSKKNVIPSTESDSVRCAKRMSDAMRYATRRTASAQPKLTAR